MSLINQVLQDLDRRQGGMLTPEGGVLADVSAVPGMGARHERRPRWRRLLAGLALLGLVGSGYWWGWITPLKPDGDAGPPVGTVVMGKVQPPRSQTLPRQVLPEMNLRMAEALAQPPSTAQRSVTQPMPTKHVVRAEVIPAPRPVAVKPGPISPRVESRQSSEDQNVPIGSGALLARAVMPASLPVTVKRPVAPDPQQRAEREVQRAARLRRQGHTALAMGHLRQALDLAPGHARARENLVVLALHEGKLDEAGRLLADLDTRQARQARWNQLRARLWLARDDLAAALLQLREIRPPWAEASTYYALEAAVLQRSGEHRQAADTYTRLLTLRPGESRWRVGQAISLEALGRDGEAREAYSAALASGSMSRSLADFVRKRLDGLEALSQH